MIIDPNEPLGPTAEERLRKMTGVKQEEHHVIVNDALKKFGYKEDSINDAERLIREAQSRIKNIRDYANLIDQEVKASGKDHDRRLLAEEIFNKVLNNFHHYNKDELLLFLTRIVSEMVMSEIV